MDSIPDDILVRFIVFTIKHIPCAHGLASVNKKIADIYHKHMRIHIRTNFRIKYYEYDVHTVGDEDNLIVRKYERILSEHIAHALLYVDANVIVKHKFLPIIMRTIKTNRVVKSTGRGDHILVRDGTKILEITWRKYAIVLYRVKNMFALFKNIQYNTMKLGELFGFLGQNFPGIFCLIDWTVTSAA